MAKKKTFTEEENMLNEVIEARLELQRAEQMFDFAENDYFDIANTELTIAKMKYDCTVQKMKKLDSAKNLPHMDLFFDIAN